MAKVNPKVAPCPYAFEVEQEIRENGGSMTAEEWGFTAHYECVGSGPSRARALAAAGEDGAIVGSSGYWRVFRKRPTIDHDHKVSP